jgi:exosome complex exonuclease DIS3/RRP44
MFKRDTQFDAENYTITIPSSTTELKDVNVSVFDKVVVDIEVEKDKNTQRGRVKMTLVSPVDSRAL